MNQIGGNTQFIQFSLGSMQPQIRTVQYVFINPGDEEVKQPVPEEVVKKFPETKIEEQCAICQEGGNEGI